MLIRAGARFGPYEIVAPVGAGGMGEVYRARDTRLDRSVAIKVLSSLEAAGPERLERFRHEARAISRLNHPHICTLHDVGEENGVAFLVMEYLEGVTLAERLESSPLPLEQVLSIGVEIAEALDRAHREGIVHRDLKPSNVMLTRDGAKILDFGLAKLREPEAAEEGDPTDSMHLTAEGLVLGTLPYMAPEQLEGKKVDARTDVFALGTLLYETITSKRPFAGDSRASLIASILTSEPPPLTELRPRASPLLERVVRRCLAKDPEERWQSARDIAAELRWLLEAGSQAGVASPAAAKGRARQRQVWLAAAAGGALIAGAAVWALAVRGLVGEQRASPPTFRPITFGAGTVSAARFAPDGQTVVYSAAWQGRPYQLFLARLGNPEALTLGFREPRILSISARGEMALVLGPQRLSMGQGTLVRAPLTGGAPRELLENVREADWAPDGATLAVVRRVGEKDAVEFPVGQKIAEATNVWGLRVSPQGDRVAFFEGPWHAKGDLVAVDRSARKQVVSAGWEVGLGLAWSPRGDEVWFAGTKGDLAPSLLAVPASGGRERLLARAPQPLLLHDVFPDGRALVSSARLRGGISCLLPGETEERELGWLDWSWVADVSADARLVLFSEEHAGGAPKGAVYLRATDGSPAVRLGDGDAEGLSPDGKWALTKSRERPQWVLLPTGAGSPRTLPRGNLVVALSHGDWLPDARRIVFSARDEGGAVRGYVQDIEDGALRPLTPPGVDIRLDAATPDGKYVTAWMGGRHLLFPVAGGEPRPTAYLTPDDSTVQWSADGRFLYVRTGGAAPAQLDRIDMKTGSRKAWKTLMPRDPSGIERVYPIVITPDGRAYCYSYARTLNDLYLVEGLR